MPKHRYKKSHRKKRRLNLRNGKKKMAINCSAKEQTLVNALHMHI